MGPISGIVVYLIIWWLVLFVVLPFGVRTQHETGEGIEPGTPESAPAKSRILFKFSVTTGIATTLWAMAYAIIKYEIISIS
ncbi:MAG: DUF1467 family protein [Rhodospirillales bacterium]|nr:DUF1467 family protein [Rhodospirillales bacterium]